MEKYFKVGQKACDIRYGEGTVIDTNYNGDYHILVEFSPLFSIEYTFDGRETIEENIILFQTAPIITPNVPIIEFEKGELVLVRNGNQWFMRYYSHFENNKHYCFENQNKEGTVSLWKQTNKYNDNPLLDK